jgi:hypothetical protein
LSASQRLQRIETTAVAVEWLALGGLAFWLAQLLGVWLVRRLAAGWWGAPLIFAFSAALLLPVALYVGGLYRWRLQVVLTAAGIALAFGMALATPAGLAVYVILLLQAVYVGAISAVVSFVMIALIVLSEWVQPASSTTIAAWAITTTGVVLLNVKTLDLKTHGAEVLLRIRNRVRSRRLPVRIEMTRR